MKNTKMWFTWVELVIVLSILAVLSYIWAKTFTSHTSKSKIAEELIFLNNTIQSWSLFTPSKFKEIINIDNNVYCYSSLWIENRTNNYIFCYSNLEKKLLFINRYIKTAENQKNKKSLLNSTNKDFEDYLLKHYKSTQFNVDNSFVLSIDSFFDKVWKIYYLKNEYIKNLIWVELLVAWEKIQWQNNCFLMWFKENDNWYYLSTNSDVCDEYIKNNNINITINSEIPEIINENWYKQFYTFEKVEFIDGITTKISKSIFYQILVILITLSSLIGFWIWLYKFIKGRENTN